MLLEKCSPETGNSEPLAHRISGPWTKECPASPPLSATGAPGPIRRSRICLWVREASGLDLYTAAYWCIHQISGTMV